MVKFIARSLIGGALLLGLFSMSSYAASSKISLVDAAVETKSQNASVGNLSVNGEVVKGQISLSRQNDFVELKLAFANNSSDDYTVSSVSDDYSGEYLQIDYRYDSVLAAGTTGNIYAYIKYDKQLINRQNLDIDNITITIN